MKKILFYIPAIIFTIFNGYAIAKIDRSVSHVAIVWLVLFLISGIFLSKDIFWGSLLGILPAIHLIYMGTQEKGQVINEIPIGIIVFIFYFTYGSFIFYKNKKI